MGEWKAQISLRVRQDLRREMEEFADKERRKLGNVGEVLLEWHEVAPFLYVPLMNRAPIPMPDCGRSPEEARRS